ncbi:MAG: monofunctional biosynthetic peptidoglycan transglycosylase [Burkholderiaceae bacterium]
MARRRAPDRTRQTQPARPWRGRLWRGLLVLVAGVSIFLLLSWQSVYLVHVLALRGDEPQRSAYMLAHERLTGREPLQHWVPIDRISPELQRAVLIAEDARFYSHWGVDPFELADAIGDSIEAGRVVRGASTITMQLARNLFLSGERRVSRKLQEMVIALMMEAVLDKRRILEIYLNVAQWGGRVYGIGAAAEHYFATDASALTAAQSAWLAPMLPAPAYYDLHRDTPGLRARRAAVLRVMQHAQDP